MQDKVLVEESKGEIESRKREWHRPHLIEVFYPQKIGSTQDRHNWITAMMLDARLGDRDKVVLSRLALHLNLKTQRLDPTLDLLALETSLGENEQSARRMVRRSLERAESLGWIERTQRNAGWRLNRSNTFRLTIPKDIRPDKFDESSGQIEQVVRTNQAGRPDSGDRENREGGIGNENREREHSVSKDTASLASLADASEMKEVAEGPLRGRETSERPSPDLLESFRGYTDAELETVRHGIENFYLDTVAAVVGFARERGYFLTGNAVGCMIRDGHIVRDGEHISLPAA
jgi:hypothetical protein